MSDDRYPVRRRGALGPIAACALLAGCSLIVDHKLAGRSDGGAPADGIGPGDIGPGPGAPSVKLEVLTPAIWPNGQLRLAVRVERFALRPGKIGHPPAPGEGHYTVVVDNGKGVAFDLPPGAEPEYVVDFGVVRGDARVLPPGTYEVTVTLVDNAGTPVLPPAADSDKFEICGVDIRDPGCGEEPPPPVDEPCAPQDPCSPSCSGPCPECLARSCPAGTCVAISMLVPVVVEPGAPMMVELDVTEFALSYPWTDPPPPSGKEGYYRIFLEGGPTRLLLAEGGANPVEVQMRADVVPRAEPYLLVVELVNPDGSLVTPPVQACWPVFVTDATVQPTPP